MAAVHASLLAKDINNNILAALPVEKMSTQALYNQRSVVQSGLISDLEGVSLDIEIYGHSRFCNTDFRRYHWLA